MTFLVRALSVGVERCRYFYISGVLVQIKEALRPDGLFLGAMLGGDTLFELRQENSAYVSFPLQPA
jgi:hypothetical protein